AVGGPEDLVMRSARARAQATGASVDDILSAWAGGQAAPAAPAPAAPEASAEEARPEPAVADPVIPPSEAPAPSPVPAPPSAQAAAQPGRTVTAVAPVVAGPPKDAAPLLTGRVDHPLRTFAALVALFVFGALLAVALPASDARSIAAGQVPGTTPILTALGEQGHAVYVREGCVYCHTQQVRTVVTDVGLGTVTEPGTSPAIGPSTLGTQRIGPDLAHVGSRAPTDNPAYLRELLEDPRGINPDSLMPAYRYLSSDDVDALVQYLVESK
ncbi:MAG: cbb3-type cytochrome c oxidase subunit II, partial [Acidimicrobiia bacterium]|nr:cbb3-type cytochrome c oxidase subunit II [Acidimicrobiia bacterium]